MDLALWPERLTCVVTVLLVWLTTVQSCGMCCGISQNHTCDCRVSVLRPTWLFLRAAQLSRPSGLSRTGTWNRGRSRPASHSASTLSRTHLTLLHSRSLPHSSCTSDLAEAGVGGGMLIKGIRSRFQSRLLASLQSTKQPCHADESRTSQHRSGRMPGKAVARGSSRWAEVSKLLEGLKKMFQENKNQDV